MEKAQDFRFTQASDGSHILQQFWKYTTYNEFVQPVDHNHKNIGEWREIPFVPNPDCKPEKTRCSER